MGMNSVNSGYTDTSIIRNQGRNVVFSGETTGSGIRDFFNCHCFKYGHMILFLIPKAKIKFIN